MSPSKRQSKSFVVDLVRSKFKKWTTIKATVYALLGISTVVLIRIRSGNVSVINESSTSSSLSAVIQIPSYEYPTGWWTPLLNHIKPWTFQTTFDWCVLPPSSETTTTNMNAFEEHNFQQPTEAELQRLKYYGFLYVKTHKCSSSTLAGIDIRISRRVGSRVLQQSSSAFGNKNKNKSEQKACPHENRHPFANDKYFRYRARDKSFLWSFTRHPAKRDMSAVYHSYVSRDGLEPTDDNIIRTIEEHYRGYQTEYLASQEAYNRTYFRAMETSPDDLWELVSTDILDSYDFLGVVERMTESLAVMTFLLNLDPSDVVVLSAKKSGGYDAQKKCTLIQKANWTQGIKEYFASNRYVHNNPDLLLYYAVNQKLDRTIDLIGYEKVQERADTIRRLEELAERECQDEAIFPCSATGQPQHEQAQSSCYIKDSGCGFKCVDRVLRNQGYP